MTENAPVSPGRTPSWEAIARQTERVERKAARLEATLARAGAELRGEVGRLRGDIASLRATAWAGFGGLALVLLAAYAMAARGFGWW